MEHDLLACICDITNVLQYVYGFFYLLCSVGRGLI